MVGLVALLHATFEDLQRRRLLWPAALMVAMIVAVPALVFGSGSRGEAAPEHLTAAAKKQESGDDVVVASQGGSVGGALSGAPHDPFAGPTRSAGSSSGGGAASSGSAGGGDSGISAQPAAAPQPGPAPAPAPDQGQPSDPAPQAPQYAAVLGLNRDGAGWRGLMAREGRWLRSRHDQMLRIETVTHDSTRVYLASDVDVVKATLKGEHVAYDYPTRILVIGPGAAVSLRDDRRPGHQHSFVLRLTSIVRR